MKMQKIKSAGVFLLAAFMLTGLNAQSIHKGGHGQGQGQRHHGTVVRQGHRPHANMTGQRRERLAHHFSIDLSEEQKAEMKSLKYEHFKTMKPLKSKMVELKARERTLLSEENIELKSVYNIIDEQTDLMNKIKKLQVEHRLNAKSILTEEQVMKLEQRRKIIRHRRPFQKSMG